jgi:sigma-B regulation protein RsbU (phosphoserine phosphatase)
VSELERTSGLPLGIVARDTWTEQEVTLVPGDALLLYTDGITEAMAPRRGPESPELFGLERLDRAIVGGESAQACIDRICRAVKEFTEDGAPTDDRTLIAVRCLSESVGPRGL